MDNTNEVDIHLVDDEERVTTSGKTVLGRFAPCNTYGKGRPPGTRNKTSVLLREMVEGHGAEIMHTAIEKARRGDPTCIKILLDRILPKAHDRSIQLELPELNNPSDAKKALESVLQAVSNGDISPSEGQAVSHLIEDYCRISQYERIEARVNDIERALLIKR